MNEQKNDLRKEFIKHLLGHRGSYTDFFEIELVHITERIMAHLPWPIKWVCNYMQLMAMCKVMMINRGGGRKRRQGWQQGQMRMRTRTIIDVKRSWWGGGGRSRGQQQGWMATRTSMVIRSWWVGGGRRRRQGWQQGQKRMRRIRTRTIIEVKRSW